MRRLARHFFCEGFAVALEDGEVADQVEVAVGVEDALEEGFEGICWGGFETRPCGGWVGAACVCGDGLGAAGEGDDVVSLSGGITPGHEAVASGGEGADLGVDTI